MHVVPGINYSEQLKEIRNTYVLATPRQRLKIIRQRLDDHHFGPNRLVTSVSAVEAFSRSLIMNKRATTKADLKKLYAHYRDLSPNNLILEYLEYYGVTDPIIFFKEDNWILFEYAVKYRNMLAHECTYLGLDKFPSLISACEEVLESLAEISGLGKITTEI